MQCARLGSFPGKVGPGGPQMGDRSERAVCGVASACISNFFIFFILCGGVKQGASGFKVTWA